MDLLRPLDLVETLIKTTKIPNLEHVALLTRKICMEYFICWVLQYEGWIFGFGLGLGLEYGFVFGCW